MTKDHNPRRSDPEWAELIADCRQSGLSDDCWCKNNNIPVSTFYNAVSRLRKKACHIPAREKQDAASLTAPQDVVPISIIPEIPSRPIQPTATDVPPIHMPTQTAIEILAASAVIRVSNGTDPQLLSHVLHLMGEIR